MLQAEALITGYMTLRPTGMQSETHRMLVKAVGQKHNKIARLRMAPDPLIDPEREQKELAKQSAKKAKRKAHDIDGGLGGKTRRRQRRQTREWSDDDDGDGVFGGSSDDDDLGRSRTKSKSKVTDDKKADYQEDGFVVADEDEAGSDAGGGGVDVMEDLDKMEAQIDARQRNGRSKGGVDADAEGDEGMDVESEEEEEEDDRIRRAGKPGTRRRQVYEEEEDE